jgi:hypothetical protein
MSNCVHFDARIKAQIRYPAGLAPWTLPQYKLLDGKPTSLLRQIYGLRRTFPTALIYTPTSLGGCGEERISDTAQLQKWTYLQLVAHLGDSSSQVVEDLICRAQRNTILSPSRYCSSLLDWGHQLGLSLSKPTPTPLPQGVVDFITALADMGQVTVYTDGSFELVRVPLLSALTLSKTDQTTHYGRGATGIYVPSSARHPAIALQLTTPLGRATDAYYKELLGTAMGALMVQHTPVNAYSDCQAAIRRFRHASNPLGASIGHLQYGPLLHGIRQLMLPSELGHALQWTKSHPERFKPRQDWTADDQGIYMADLVAGELTTLHREIQITTFTADAESLLNALVPAGQWIWTTGSQLFTGSLRHSMQRLHYQEYLVNRDNNRQLRAATA